MVRRTKLANAYIVVHLFFNRINVTIRREMGSDIDAACGQLRKNFMEQTKTTEKTYV